MFYLRLIFNRYGNENSYLHETEHLRALTQK